MSTQSDTKRIKKLFKTLPVKLQKSVFSGGVRAGAAVVRIEVRERAPKDELNLQKAIAIKKRRTRKGSTDVRYSVYIKKVELPNGTKRLKNTKQYGYYMEYGTKDIRAKPFIRPAAEAVGQKPVTAARDYIKKKLPEKIKQSKRR